MTGVFIGRGITPVIPVGGLSLSIGDDGEMKATVTLHIHYDLCSKWLEIAARHLSDAKERKLERVAAWTTDDEDAKGRTLEQEFEASMQAIMAAAIALDAFYATIKDKTNIPENTFRIWKAKKRARHAQIGEVLRQAYSLPPGCVKELKGALSEIFKFRDWAVHPPGGIQAPVLHPEIGVGVEWRFVSFSAESATLIVTKAQSIISDLTNKGKPSNPEIQRYTEGLRSLLATALT